MEELSSKEQDDWQTLASLITGKKPKKKRLNGEGMLDKLARQNQEREQTEGIQN